MKKLLIIPGLPRCATTSLVNLLSQHPDIHMPRVKEPHFLIPQAVTERLYAFNADGSKKPFRNCGFITSVEQYKKNIGYYSSQDILIDASTLYSVHTGFLTELVQLEDLDPYFIILKRSPFERAFSHFCFSQSRGEEYRSFKDALQDELAGKTDDWLLGGYLKGSCYRSVEKKIIEAYGREKLLLVDIDETDLLSRELLSKFLMFLNVTDYQFSDQVYCNESGVIDNRVLASLRVVLRQLRQLNPSLIDNRLFRRLFEGFMARVQHKQSLPDDILALKPWFLERLEIEQKK